MSKRVSIAARIRPRQILDHSLCILMLTFALGSIMACMPMPQPSLGQPESPPSEVLHSPLIDNRWRVEDVLLNGKTVTFDLFKPVYVVFDHQGTLRIYSERCGFTNYAILYLSEQQFRFGQGVATAQDCGELLMRDDPTVNCAKLAGNDASRQACARAINAQLGDVNRALAATNKYELRGKQLILRGEDAEMHLVLDNPAD